LGGAAQQSQVFGRVVGGRMTESGMGNSRQGQYDKAVLWLERSEAVRRSWIGVVAGGGTTRLGWGRSRQGNEVRSWFGVGVDSGVMM